MDITAAIDARALDGSFPLPQDEPFTTAEARSAGLSRWHLEILVASGLLVRPVQGLYVVATVPDSLALRIACLRRVVPADAVVVDRHAGWLLGAEMVLAPGEHLDLQSVTLFLPEGRGRLRNALADSGERTLAARDITEIGGLRVTTALRTALDLGRVRHVDRAVSALDAMLRLGHFGHAELLADVGRFRGQRWVSTLRAVAPLADARAESPPESVLRLRCHECGLTGMVPQLEVRRPDGDFVARLDLGDEERRAGVEHDGAEWHSSPEQQRHDRERRAMVAEEGYLVEALTGANLFGPLRDVERKLYALDAEARRRQGRLAG